METAAPPRTMDRWRLPVERLWTPVGCEHWTPVGCEHWTSGCAHWTPLGRRALDPRRLCAAQALHLVRSSEREDEWGADREGGSGEGEKHGGSQGGRDFGRKAGRERTLGREE